MLKRGLYIRGHDDEGNFTYSLVETETITRQIKMVSAAEYKAEELAMREFNDYNSDSNCIKRMFEKQKKDMEESADPKAFARNILEGAGFKFNEDGTLVDDQT